MIYVDLVTAVCCVCRGPFLPGRSDRSVCGHFRSADCYGTYVTVGAAFHARCQDGHAAMPQEDGAEDGCLGPLEEWMGAEVAALDDFPYDVRRRAR